MTAPTITLRSRHGVETLKTANGQPMVGLSVAITRASRSELPGVWTVLADDVEVYRVVREEGSKPTVLIYTLA